MSEEKERGVDISVINWYPGHMTKAKREMQEKMRLVDMVIELRDARIPNASKNPMMDELCQGKPRLIILSKKDKAEPEQTQQWIKCLSNAQTQVMAFDIPKDAIAKPVIQAAQSMMQEKIARQKRRGIRPRAIRAMVVGVPNVGKSTFINKLVKKRIAQTADRPGVTRSLQWARIHDQLELLDTPGVLWPKFADPMVGMYLAVCGSIKDDVLPLEDVACWMIKELCERKPRAMEERYQVELCDDPHELLRRIAIVRGYLTNQGTTDEKRTITTFLKEVRQDKLGRITWERADGNG